MVTWMSGKAPLLSEASREFSTSSLTVVYRHLPGCSTDARVTVHVVLRLAS